jgi:hypothetical protein
LRTTLTGTHFRRLPKRSRTDLHVTSPTSSSIVGRSQATRKIEQNQQRPVGALLSRKEEVSEDQISRRWLRLSDLLVDEINALADYRCENKYKLNTIDTFIVAAILLLLV